MSRLFLLAALVASSSTALSGPFVGLNAGLSNIGYCGSYRNATATTQASQTHSIVNLSAGCTFSSRKFFATPFGEVKTIFGNDFFEVISAPPISGTRTVFGGGLGLGCHFRGFSPYARIGARIQKLYQIQEKQSIPVAGGTVSGLFKSSAYVTGLCWGLGANIPVSDTLCVNVNFTTTYQEQKTRQMAFAGNAPAGVNPSPKTAVMSQPFKRNVSDVTVGVRYSF